MNLPVLCGGALIFILASTEMWAAPQDEVLARGYFADDARKVIYIEVGKGQKLVFDRTDNDRYVLHGKPMEIRADVVVLRGDVKISSVPKKGDDNLQKVGVGLVGDPGGKGYGDGGGGGPGGQGRTGPTGLDGGRADSAKKIRLYINALTGTGSLSIDNSGAMGGTGGEGGRGGLGGKAGDGADRTKSNGPGNGAKGGPGGIGGTGGIGGPGGNGGNIEFARNLCSSIASKRLILATARGSGGDGGIGGFGGDGGARGEGGSGGFGGGGGTPGVKGDSHESVRGPTGPKGSAGTDGIIRCSDCIQSVCPAPAVKSKK